MQKNSQSLYPVFQSPPSRHYPGVYWFWHRLPEAQEIERQLQEIKDAGYRTIFIQPRLAFPRHQYLSPGYLQAYRYAMRTAKKQGLIAGLYDDYNWISGHAGGRTVEGHDHLRERHMFWSAADAKGGHAQCSISGIHNHLGDGLGEAFQTWCYEGDMHWGDWHIFGVFALAGSDAPIALEPGTHYRLEESRPDGCTIAVELPDTLPQDCRVVVFVNARCLTSRLINYLHPEAARRFITAGYEPYRRALEDYFGDPLKFLFFDQPYAGFYTWREHFGNPLNSLMFDETLVNIFEKARGYPMVQALLALILPERDDSAKLRCDFFETYGALARSRFLEPISSWAKQAGLAIAGHELLSFVGGWGFCEGLPHLDARVNFGADFFAVDGFKTHSTVDACNYHPQISARFGTSTARMWGRKGCMVEQYSVPVGRNLPAPVGQWDLTLDDLRSQAIRHLLAGASQFIFHAYYQTNTHDGAIPLKSPRFDFPPGINYEPWFRFHPQFAEEMARLGAFLEGMVTRNQVAVLYPLRTYWHEGLETSIAENTPVTESAFWNRYLSEQGVGFDIIDERQVYAQDDLAATLSDYRILILPCVSVVKDAAFADAMESFVSTGNLLLASGPLPCCSQFSGRDDVLKKRMRKLFEENVNAIHYDHWHQAGQDETLADRIMLAGADRIDIEVLDRPEMPLWIRQGSCEDEPMIALFNDSLAFRVIRLSCGDTGLVPERFYPRTGEYHRWGWFSQSDVTQLVMLPMKPRELLCLRWMKEDRNKQPHLVEMQGAVDVLAHLDGEGLEILLNCFEVGDVRLLIRSRTRPELDETIANTSISALHDDLWQVMIHIPWLPEPFDLDQGWRLRIPGHFRERPVDIRHGWEREYPDYIGAGYYRNDFALSEEDLSFGWLMRFPHVFTSLVGYLNQDLVGTCGWPPYDLELPHASLKKSYNHIELAVWNTAGNAFYHHTPYTSERLQSSGLAGIPTIIPFVRKRLFCKCN